MIAFRRRLKKLEVRQPSPRLLQVIIRTIYDPGATGALRADEATARLISGPGGTIHKKPEETHQAFAAKAHRYFNATVAFGKSINSAERK